MIIGLVGRCVDPNGNYNSASAGKDTVAAILDEVFDFERIALAEPLKQFCAEVFEFSREQLWGGSEHRNRPNAQGVTPRRALQTLGTEWGRALDPDVWIRYGLERAESVARAVITDVRFENELRAIQAHPRGRLVLVERRVDVPITPMGHQSERDLDGIFDADEKNLTWDLCIGNSGSLDDLRQNVVWAMETMLLKERS